MHFYLQAEGLEPTKQLSPSILSTGCIPIPSCSLTYYNIIINELRLNKENTIRRFSLLLIFSPIILFRNMFY